MLLSGIQRVLHALAQVMQLLGACGRKMRAMQQAPQAGKGRIGLGGGPRIFSISSMARAGWQLLSEPAAICSDEQADSRLVRAAERMQQAECSALLGWARVWARVCGGRQWPPPP